MTRAGAGGGADGQVISHPEKVLFPADGITKGELAAYYARVAPAMLPHLRRRPVTMERYPAGIDAKGFIQKDVSRGVPAWLERATVAKHGGTVHHPLIDDARALQWMANQNCVTPHIWNRRVPDLEPPADQLDVQRGAATARPWWDQPDLCVFDLDPARDEPDVLRAVMLALRDLLDEDGLPSWVKTSGSKGFHVAVPLDGTASVDAVAAFAHRTGAELARRDPDHLTLAFSKAERGGRIYVDTGRNEYSATVAAAYAVRARAGAPVSAPCTWDELASGAVGPQTFTLRTMAARLDAVGDLWADLLAGAVALPAR